MALTDQGDILLPYGSPTGAGQILVSQSTSTHDWASRGLSGRQPSGRLTLTSGTPVTTADVSAAGTIYFTPHLGNTIPLYTGTDWVMYAFTELSVAVSTSANKVFDIFLDYNAGTPQLVTTDWTNDTTRATALVYQDGVLVQTGNTDWRYLGTARTKTVSQVDDAEAFRHLWNYYNRVDKNMLVEEPADTWTYTIATIRQANGNTANQLDFVIGVAEDVVVATVNATATNASTNVSYGVGIGLDSTTTFSQLHARVSSPADGYLQFAANYKAQVAAGRHYLSWNEWAQAVGTTTWVGDNGAPLTVQAGIQGSIKC